MTLRLAATAALLFTMVACGAEADLKVGTTNTGTTNTPTTDGNSNVSGRLASSLAPPAALIVLEPQGTADLPVKAEPAIMDQAGYEFLPGFLLAQAGQSVEFRNSEDVLHNVGWVSLQNVYLSRRH